MLGMAVSLPRLPLDTVLWCSCWQQNAFASAGAITLDFSRPIQQVQLRNGAAVLQDKQAQAAQQNRSTRVVHNPEQTHPGEASSVCRPRHPITEGPWGRRHLRRKTRMQHDAL